jgi:hypothetical protein
MPLRNQHLAQADSNQRFLDSTFDLQRTNYPDWVVTAAFYVAVHLVDAFFAGISQHPYDHKIRGKAVDRELPGIAPSYKMLYLQSRAARYDCTQITNIAAQLAVRTVLPQVRRGVEALLV